MIFVTVGTARQSFARLLEAIDRIAGSPEYRDETFLLQSGHGDFQAENCEQKPFMDRDEFEETITRAEVVVAHGGGGTLLQVFRTGKVPVAMPRLSRFDEALDDHQVDLVRELAEEGRVVPAYEPDDLPAALTEARSRNEQAVPPKPSRMLDLVSEAIRDLIGPPPDTRG